MILFFSTSKTHSGSNKNIKVSQGRKAGYDYPSEAKIAYDRISLYWDQPPPPKAGTTCLTLAQAATIMAPLRGQRATQLMFHKLHADDCTRVFFVTTRTSCFPTSSCWRLPMSVVCVQCSSTESGTTLRIAGRARKTCPQHRTGSHRVGKGPNQTKLSETKRCTGGHLHLANDRSNPLLLGLRRHPPAGDPRNEVRGRRARTPALCAQTTERVEDAAAGSSPQKGDRR